MNPNAQDMMVFVLYLHHTLPQFVPRSCIDFACKLGETQVRRGQGWAPGGPGAGGRGEGRAGGRVCVMS